MPRPYSSRPCRDRGRPDTPDHHGELFISETFAHNWDLFVLVYVLHTLPIFQAVKAMHETMAFDRAIERAIEMVDFEDTLIIVTADHSHVMTMAGYPSRGTDIRGRFWF
jgi:bisphosphoglycerate-independent phosphoglycerate mutase (AlkP superfamily)